MREEGLVKEAHGQAAPSAEKVALILGFSVGGEYYPHETKYLA